MKKVISSLKDIPYSGEDIMNVCRGETKVLTYKDLNKYKHIDEILDPYDNFVLLYETTPDYGHWTCVIRHPDKNKIEFFDPYGYGIDEQFKFVKKKGINGKNENKLAELLLNSNYDIVESNAKIQKKGKNINSCGRHVGVRINMRDLPLDEYVEILRGGVMNADDTITYLTAFI